MIKIKGANHNDIFFQDLDLYMASIKELTG